MRKNKTNYTKYAEVCYRDNDGNKDVFLCGRMPVSDKIAWVDTHKEGNISIADTGDDDSYYVCVYSTLRGWEWNRKQIITFFDTLYDGCYDVEFFLYHEMQLREILGNKHFIDLLRELKIYDKYKEEIGAYVHPEPVKDIVRHRTGQPGERRPRRPRVPA